MDIRVPNGVLGRPAPEFVAALLAVNEAYLRSRDDRYLGGALVAAQWLAGHSPTRPVSADRVAPTAWAVGEETMRAGSVVYGVALLPALRAVDPQWAAGAMAMLEYARGVSDHMPTSARTRWAA